MNNAEKIALLEDLFEMEEGSLRTSQSLDEIEEWDSMTKLSLIVMVDEECGKKLKPDDIKGFKLVKDLMDFMG